MPACQGHLAGPPNMRQTPTLPQLAGQLHQRLPLLTLLLLAVPVNRTIGKRRSCGCCVAVAAAIGYADLYEVLGVPRDADGQTIKKAYRALSLSYHPDRLRGQPQV